MYNYGLELLRGVAAFGIVGCHLMLSPITESAALLKHFCDFNVAVFAVVSGYLMYSSANRMTPCEYIRHRVVRLLPAYLVWSVVFLAASVVLQAFCGKINSRFGTTLYWVDVLLRGGASCHLWFLICLVYGNIILYVVRPFLRSWGMLIMGVTLIVLATTGGSWYHDYFYRMMGFLGIGYWVRCFDETHQQRSIWMWAFLCIATMTLHVILKPFLPSFIRDLIAVIPLVELCLMLNSYIVEFPRCQKFIADLGGHSMGVYLIHPLLTRAASLFVVKLCPRPYSALIILIIWFTCFCGALMLSVVISKVPILRRIIK